MIIRIITDEEIKRINIEENTPIKKAIEEQFKCKSYTVKYNNKEIDASLGIKELGIKENESLFLQIFDKVIQTNTKQEKERLEVKDDKIIRKRDGLLCDHPNKAMCINCAPLEVYDKEYHLKNKINYLSYKSYQKKQSDNPQSKEENFACTHPTNQKCINCTNKVITLQVQQYRRIDHIEIHCKKELEHFYMVSKQSQRHKVAFLLGNYSDYDFVPLGRKAVVKTIYYPDQSSFPDGFLLKEKEYLDPFFKFELVGMIFTAPKKEYFISNLELQFIAQLQKVNRNFVTLILKEESFLDEIMVSDLLIEISDKVFSTSDPTLFKSLVDFQYREGESIRNTKFVPVEYFVVRLTHGFKKENELFVSPFFLEKNCGLKKLNKYFDKTFDESTFSNYEVVLRLSKEMDVSLLVSAIIKKDPSLFSKFSTSDEFVAFKERLAAFDEEWVCNACTFVNKIGEFCEMCNTKRIHY